jgi:osmotically-inducible protein OsmY
MNIDVDNKVVTLRGHVGSAAAKSEADRIAKETDGVKTVHNQLSVAPAG